MSLAFGQSWATDLELLVGGERLDAICSDGIPLARRWPPAGPKVLWSVELGQGFAAAAVAAGCVYVLDYDEQAKADTMRCLSLDDGREIPDWFTFPDVAKELFDVACSDAEGGFPDFILDLAERDADAPGCSDLVGRKR